MFGNVNAITGLMLLYDPFKDTVRPKRKFQSLFMFQTHMLLFFSACRADE